MVAQDAHPASLTGAGVGDQDDQKAHKGEINRGGGHRHLTRPPDVSVHLPMGGSPRTPSVTRRTSLGNGIVFNS
ncbi:hypothetical protein P376_4087 [Streptomyces sp. HCCB10043]|nr:hypothetical protein P376_4087 [Streptomyces sp. HCCB10043]